MQEKTEIKLLLYFVIIYTIIFEAVSIIRKNYEFIFTIGITSLLLLIVILYYKKFHLSSKVVAGLTLLGFMHVIGGNIYINSTRLYDIWILHPILQYDNLMHFLGLFIITIIVYNLLYPHLDKKIEHNKLLLSLLIILASLGVGVFNEIIEVVAVVFLGAAKQVGDYMNNAQDLIFNLLGSIAAVIFVIHHHKKHLKKKK